MDNTKYTKRVNVLNTISQHIERINKLIESLENLDNVEFKNSNKLNKGINYLNSFVLNEKKFMKKVRKEYYSNIKKINIENNE